MYLTPIVNSNSHDQPSKITLPYKTDVRYSYDMAGRLVQLTDPKGRSTRLEYDLLGRIRRLTDPAGNPVKLQYDPLDDLTALTDPIGTKTTYTHDDLGQRRKETSPDRGTLTYDSAGKLTRTTDATGRTTRTTYDASSRPVTITHIHEGKKLTVSYTYGKEGGAQGNVTRIQEPTGSQDYSYTPFGDIESYTQTLTGGPTTTLAWEYGEAGRPVTMTLPGGEALHYAYDQAGRTTALTLDGKPLLTNIQYHHSGQLRRATYGNGLAYQAEYDAMGRMTTQTRGKKTVAYAYDPAGNLTRQGKATYHYDKLDRLIGATEVRLPGKLEQGDIRYDYDANGNRSKAAIGQTRHRYQYAKGRNRITAIDGQPLHYDKAGRLIQDPRFTYRYDTRGRLAQVTNNSGTIAAYAYNEKGLRIRKTTRPGTKRETTTWYAYDPQGRLIAEYTTTNNGKPRLAREYVWLGDTPIALIDRASKTNDINYIHPDHLNTPRVVTDSQGREVWRWDSTPFGIGKPDEDPDHDGKKLTLNLRFPGQYYDEETGLHYNYFRTYDPATGRYLESDPIGLQGGLNTYTYVGNNPLTRIDPLGLDWQFTIGIGGSFGGSPIIVPPGAFGGGGLSIGFTSSGQLIIQAQATGSVGGGAFAGVGLQAGATKSKCPTESGISVQRSLQGDFNFGAGPFVGGSIQYDPVNEGGGIQAGVGKIGVGYGLQVSGGVTQTVTIATPALFPSDLPCECK